MHQVSTATVTHSMSHFGGEGLSTLVSVYHSSLGSVSILDSCSLITSSVADQLNGRGRLLLLLLVLGLICHQTLVKHDSTGRRLVSLMCSWVLRHLQKLFQILALNQIFLF